MEINTDTLRDIIDKRELLKYREFLIKINNEGAEFSTSDENVNLELKEAYQSNEGEIKLLCKIANLLRYYSDLDSSKHNEYRFACGILPNNDKSIEELEKIIPEDMRQKLWDAGYEIIKDIYNAD